MVLVCVTSSTDVTSRMCVLSVGLVLDQYDGFVTSRIGM